MPAEVIPVGGTETGISAEFTTAQTSERLGPDVEATQRLRVTYLQLDWDGETEGDVVVYFGDDAFVRGTNKALFDGGGHPTADSRGGFSASKPGGWDGGLGEELRITTSDAIKLNVTVWYSIVMG